ncbi:hypothetical protein J3F83DRAFT_515412 [Trichoderma novae-zelandiae]
MLHGRATWDTVRTSLNKLRWRQQPFDNTTHAFIHCPSHSDILLQSHFYPAEIFCQTYPLDELVQYAKKGFVSMRRKKNLASFFLTCFIIAHGNCLADQKAESSF